MCFYIEYRENKYINDFLSIFISMFNYIDLILSDHVENIKFFI